MLPISHSLYSIDRYGRDPVFSGDALSILFGKRLRKGSYLKHLSLSQLGSVMVNTFGVLTKPGRIICVFLMSTPLKIIKRIVSILTIQMSCFVTIRTLANERQKNQSMNKHAFPFTGNLDVEGEVVAPCMGGKRQLAMRPSSSAFIGDFVSFVSRYRKPSFFVFHRVIITARQALELV